jgi:hypothetical protein
VPQVLAPGAAAAQALSGATPEELIRQLIRLVEVRLASSDLDVHVSVVSGAGVVQTRMPLLQTAVPASPT